MRYRRQRFGGFFDFRMPPFGVYFQGFRRFPRREDYIRMLEEYRDELREELKEIEEEIEELRKEAHGSA